MRKKWMWLLPALFVLLAGCGRVAAPVVTNTPSPSPVPTNTPVPTPVPIVAVVADAAYAGFWEGVQGAESADGAALQIVEGGLAAVPALTFDGASVILAYLDGTESDYAPLIDAIGRGSFVYAYAAAGQTLPAEIPVLTYEDAGAAVAALDAAIAYPPHDTPVRLFGLFSNAESEAYALWSEAVASGRVLVKAVFYESDGETPFADWMAKRLERAYPGMIDGVYAETAELAIQATDALAAAGRTDMEVFAAEVNDAVLAKMLEFPDILVSATGANPVRAGRILRENASAMLAGLLPESRQLLPRTFDAATLADNWSQLSAEAE